MFFLKNLFKHLLSLPTFEKKLSQGPYRFTQGGGVKPPFSAFK